MILIINTISQFIKLLKRNLLTLHLIFVLNKMKILIKKIVNLKLMTTLEFQNTENIFPKGYTPNWSEEFLLLVKLKI